MADSARLIVTAEEKLLTNHASFTWDETVDLALLPPGATGLDLLDHVATILGSSYEVTWHEDAAFVDEVNGVASEFTLILIGYFWALLEDGAYSDHAINEITLAPGTTLELQYEGWPLDL